MDNQTMFNWREALSDTYHELFQQLIGSLPQLLGAVSLLVVGWFFARLMRMLVQKTILALDGMLPKALVKRDANGPVFSLYARWCGNIVYWAVLLFFVAASARLLQWQIFSGLTSALFAYLPNLLVGVLVILAGFALSSVARTATESAVNSAGLGQAAILATLAQVTVVLTTLVIGVEQLGLNITFLTTTLIVIAAVILFGAALAFGFGARDFIANSIGATNLRKYFRIGQTVRVTEIHGEILEITQTSLILETDTGRAVIPAKLFHEVVFETIDEGESGALADPPHKEHSEDNLALDSSHRSEYQGE